MYLAALDCFAALAMTTMAVDSRLRGNDDGAGSVIRAPAQAGAQSIRFQLS